MAVALALVAAVAARALEGPLAGLFFSLPVVAVVISGFVGSVGSALVTAVLSALGMALLQLNGPRLPLSHTVETYRLVGFVAVALLVAWLSGSRSAAYRREHEAWREADAARVRAEAAVEEARRLASLQEQVMAVVGHDLRTPLSAVRLGSAVLLRRGGITDEQRTHLERIAASAARMARMISDLVDFTRVRRGMALPLHKRRVDLADTCREALAELQQVHPDREIALHVDDGATCEGDAHRLSQVVSNLLGNALQHGSPTKPVVLDVRHEDSTLAVSVHNDGAIAPEVLPFIFEPFRRGRSDQAGDSLSIGLGLFIVREIVTAHGGVVEVESEQRAGTTFTIRLPAAYATADVQPREGPSAGC